MKRIIFYLLLACLPAFAANDVYIAATSAGGNTGLDCANAKALTYFNSAGNWSATPTGIQIGPDTTAHFCGTFTASSGANSYIQFQGSGTSGHPVTMKWETGAIVQSSDFGASPGAIDTNAETDIIIDGGTNGILQNTDNGTALTHQSDSIGIQGAVCTRCVVTNLSIVNLYVHTLATDESGGTVYGIDFQGGSNITIGPNVTIHDANVGILYAFVGANYTNLSIHDDLFYNTNQSVEVGNIGARQLDGLSFFANDCHDWANWDDNLNNNHHNCLHTFVVGAAAKILTEVVYNNYPHGDLGNHATSMFFFESNTGGLDNAPYVFNNIFNHTSSTNAGGNGLIRTEGVGGLIVNNTFIDAGGSGANAWNCLDIAAPSGFSGWTVHNNIFKGCDTYIYIEPTGSPAFQDFNDYFGGSPQWVWQTSFDSTIGAWRTDCDNGTPGSCDPSAVITDPNLNGSFQPVLPTGATGGTNYTFLGVTALHSDKNGNARPATGATSWTKGALNAAPSGFVPQIGGFLVQ